MHAWTNRITSRFSLVAALLVGGLAVAGLFSWLAIESAANRVSEAVELSVQLQEALDTGRAAQVHFKVQVQEWKDILLRGRDAAAYERHAQNFERESEKTENSLLQLRVTLAHLGLRSEAANEALHTHEHVMVRYREALAAYDRAGRSDSHAADAAVTAIDREPMRQIGSVVDYVRGESARLLDAQRQSAIGRAQVARQVLVVGICGVVAAALLILFAFARERLGMRALRATASIGNWSMAAMALLGVIAMAVLVGRAAGDALAAAERVAHPHEVRAQLEQLKTEANAADESARDFASEKNAETEREFQAAAAAVRSRIDDLRRLPDPDFAPGEIERLDEAARGALAYDGALIRARREGGADTARQVLLGEGAGALRDTVAQIDQMLARQGTLLTQRQANLDGEVSLLRWSLIATAVLVLLMLSVVGMLLLRDQRQRRAAQEQLRSENKRLEEAVRERTTSLVFAKAELERLSRRSLQRQEQERHHISTELHDDISGQVAALLMNLQRIARSVPPGADPQLVAGLQESIYAAKSTYREVCELAIDLRPAMLDQLGLVATLEWFAREVPKDGDCAVTVKVEPLGVEPGADVATVIYRIVEEAVRNALSHGRPRTITIELGMRGNILAVRVADDGRGFVLDTAENPDRPLEGLGLPVMRQRAASLGGTLEIVSSPGAGTQVLLDIPIEEPHRLLQQG